MKKFVFMLIVAACSSTPAIIKSSTYEEQLIECNVDASTFEQSVSCENEVRARFNRPPRVVSVLDGGAK